MEQAGTETRIAWRTLEPFGVELIADLAQPFSAEDEVLLRALVDRHGLLLARGQLLSLERQLDIMRVFGLVLGDRATLNYVAPDDGVLGLGSLGFHSDLAFAPEPFAFISLHALDVDDGQTCTLFADGEGAYGRLDESLRRQLEGMSAAAVSSSASGRAVGYHIPSSAHRHDRPVVIAHPRTGHPVLYVNQAQTARINELGPQDSEQLLERLFGVLYDPGNIYEHRWSCGDLVIWDNIRLQHARPALDGVTRRKLQRAVVARRSLYEQIPDFRPGDPMG